MGLFGLFGGKKKDEAKVVSAAPTSAPHGKPSPSKAEPAKAPTAKPVATAGPPVAAIVPSLSGVGQVKLRLKLVHSLRAGEHAAAYAAATGLADIQAKAGRRTQARAWREQAERIKANA
ncbi:MAG TPA: hypothetical protein VG942_09445 [Hyphomonadaceae bacterium]|nr:hypothetical protein [Hyphomonadaceae bacterium]